MLQHEQQARKKEGGGAGGSLFRYLAVRRRHAFRASFAPPSCGCANPPRHEQACCSPLHSLLPLVAVPHYDLQTSELIMQVFVKTLTGESNEDQKFQL